MDRTDRTIFKTTTISFPCGYESGLGWDGEEGIPEVARGYLATEASERRQIALLDTAQANGSRRTKRFRA